MKIVNVLLCVLILLMAVASAVFSYFLYEKRVQLTTGWDKMATTLSKSATAIDKTNETPIAKDLTKEALGHTKYDSLDGNLSKYEKVLSDVLKQRDALAESLSRASGVVGKTVDAKTLIDMNSSTSAQSNAVKVISDTIKKHNALIDQITKMVNSALNIKVNSSKLIQGDPDAVREVTEAFTQLKTRRQAYEKSIRDINSKTQAGVPNFDDKNLTASLTKSVQAVDKLNSNYKQALAKADKAEQERKELTQQLAACNELIEHQRNTIHRREAQLNDLKRALGLELKDSLPEPWVRGSIEARRAIRGRVLEVNEHYGYVCINLGKKSLVEQRIGNKIVEIEPVIETGMELVISRGDIEQPNAEFITRVTVTDIADDCLLASLPANSKQVVVGDLVYYELPNKDIQADENTEASKAKTEATDSAKTEATAPANGAEQK